MRGICTHLIGTDVAAELKAIKAAGYDCIRQDLYWNITNPKPGVYDFSKYDLIAETCEELGLKVLWVLCFGNNYLMGTPDDKTPPRIFSERYRWGQWLELVRTRFANRKSFHGVEVWNEPNHVDENGNGVFWKPKPSVKDYITLAIWASDVFSGCRRIYVGALANNRVTGGLDYDWIKEIAPHIGGRWILSLHPYKVDVDQLMKVQDILAPGQDVEPRFAVTENGWSRAWGGSQPQMNAMLQKQAEEHGYEMWLYCWDNIHTADPVEQGFSVKPRGAVSAS
jgi:hypothetical protein